MKSVDQQRTWWEQELAGLGLDSAGVLVHARVGARLLADPDGSCALAGGSADAERLAVAYLERASAQVRRAGVTPRAR